MFLICYNTGDAELNDLFAAMAKYPCQSGSPTAKRAVPGFWFCEMSSDPMAATPPLPPLKRSSEGRIMNGNPSPAKELITDSTGNQGNRGGYGNRRW